MKSLDQIRSEFDRIADLSSRLPDVLGPHERSLLRHLPKDASIALDLGCGTGALARRLALHCKRVVAIDTSLQMIQQARTRSARFPNIEFHVSEIGEWLDAHGSYDCITATAVLHHVEIKHIVEKIVRALRSGGTLLIVDVITRPGLRNLPVNAISSIIAGLRRLIVLRTLSRDLGKAWREHGSGETYLTISEARRLFERLLPASQVRHHLLWRYSVVWSKP
jgi:2-polyprenyl-3-methyl-5-hydroxy-6-metoxy-1,4-benzoquinol methylase